MEIDITKDSSCYVNNPTNVLVENPTTKILRESNAFSFHSSLPNYKPTPVIELPALAKKHKVGKIYLKDESSRFGLKAFKALGASYAINQILKTKNDVEVFCTATDGNQWPCCSMGG